MISARGKQARIFTDNSSFFDKFHELGKGDTFVGRLRLRPGEEFLLNDLAARGVNIFPSGLSQQLSRSKCMQAALLGQFMLPHTRVIFTQHDMLAAVNHYTGQNIGQVISKDDRRNAGMGILRWQSVEDLFNQATLGTISYPFVIQPYEDGARDIRVVALGEYWEAYWRDNPDNFRNNLHFGAESEPCQLRAEQERICRDVMARGCFPYGHIDLMVTKDNLSYVAEINLRGGIRGAAITPPAYQGQIDLIHQQYIDSLP
ncbi:MAG: hypothetical protein ABFR97_06830 [Thermodesulfobacteriota bacterium]